MKNTGVPVVVVATASPPPADTEADAAWNEVHHFVNIAAEAPYVCSEPRPNALRMMCFGL